MRALKCALALGIIALAAVVVRAARQPRASPHDSVSASIDGASLSIAYGRPYMRGRQIFGSLVPYGRVWCPGADEATTLSTSQPLAIGPLRLDAPQYTLWFLPDAETWQLVISKETGQWHTQYRSANDLGRMPLETHALEAPVEQLTFSFKKNADGGGGAIVFRWATTEATIPFRVESGRMAVSIAPVAQW